MSTSDTSSLTPEEIDAAVPVINSLTNDVAGLNEAIKAGITPSDIDSSANSVAIFLIDAARTLGPLTTVICGIVNAAV